MADWFSFGNEDSESGLVHILYNPLKMVFLLVNSAHINHDPTTHLHATCHSHGICLPGEPALSKDTSNEVPLLKSLVWLPAK